MANTHLEESTDPAVQTKVIRAVYWGLAIVSHLWLAQEASSQTGSCEGRSFCIPGEAASVFGFVLFAIPAVLLLISFTKRAKPGREWFRLTAGVVIYLVLFVVGYRWGGLEFPVIGITMLQ